MSKTATFGQDNTPVFSTNILKFLFEGNNPSFNLENTAPPSGVLSYTNAAQVPVSALPLGSLSIAALPGGQAAVVWNPPGTLQVTTSLTGGAWTNLPAATSPYIIPVSGTVQLFRLAQ